MRGEITDLWSSALKWHKPGWCRETFLALPHSHTLPLSHSPNSLFLKVPFPQSYFATIKVLGRFIPPKEKPARSGHIVNLCVASFCSVVKWLGCWQPCGASPEGEKEKTWLQTAAAKKCSSWGLSDWCDSVFAQIACRPFSLMPSIFSQCHCKESTPERPSEALLFKTRSFLTETLSLYLS